MHRSEVRKPKANASELVWHVPLALLRHAAFAGLKLTHKILFVVLWKWAGCRPGSVPGSCSAIAAELGVADRRIREWLPRLADVGLVVIVDWTREGALTLEINDPAEVARGRVRKPDPQGTLFDDDEPDESEPPPAVSVRFPPAEAVPKAPTPSGDATPRAQSSRVVSSRDGEISAETIKTEWPTLRPTFIEIKEALCPGQTALADRDEDLFVRVAYLAGDAYGRSWLDAALRRVREIRPGKRVGCFLAVLAYMLSELETGAYPRTKEAKTEARHRLGRVLRNIHLPPCVRPERTEPDEDAQHIPTAEENEQTRQYLREHGPARHRRRQTGDEPNE